MRTFVFLAMLAVMVRLPAQDKPKDDKGNPFGVPINVKAVGADEKPMDPALTDDERAFLKKYYRLERDEPGVRHDGAEVVYDKIAERFKSGVKNWTEADAQAREKMLEELSSIEYGEKRASQVYSCILSYRGDGKQTLIEYIAGHDDNPDALVKRISMFSKLMMDCRPIVLRFLKNDKFKNSTAVERYQFVVNWLTPKLSARDKYTLIAWMNYVSALENRIVTLESNNSAAITANRALHFSISAHRQYRKTMNGPNHLTLIKSVL